MKIKTIGRYIRWGLDAILMAPALLLGNPLFSNFFQGIKFRFWSLYYTIYVGKFRSKFYCHDKLTTFAGSKYMTFGEKITINGKGEIYCLDSYSGHHYAPKLSIGTGVVLTHNFHIGCINKISIGDNCIIGSNVLIEDHSHGNPKDTMSYNKWEAPLYSKGSIIIGNNVWIGENVCILPNVHIGDNSVIGAGSIVTHDVEANSVYAGNPAHKIR